MFLADDRANPPFVRSIAVARTAELSSRAKLSAVWPFAETLEVDKVGSLAQRARESPELNGASMKPPTLSRPGGKLFLLFLIYFGRHLTITHLFGFGA
jgi:hypothetical protein